MGYKVFVVILETNFCVIFQGYTTVTINGPQLSMVFVFIQEQQEDDGSDVLNTMASHQIELINKAKAKK